MAACIWCRDCATRTSWRRGTLGGRNGAWGSSRRRLPRCPQASPRRPHLLRRVGGRRRLLRLVAVAACGSMAELVEEE
ncbi:hypothetical protein E2562_031844 [Oryza meyeriana var. granulata]|uniref:Uncharacterized protein n=1 Tax=Oryza meyeriana var. granulata TaxID=110450 RepID=A0A6G1CVJ4_9ORYZ|nr:hypothetical protein E2562_031844 [Oryza meyeriana var. granulata]